MKKVKPFELFKDSKGKWRWRATAFNGRILAQSSESYTRRVDCSVGAAATLGILDNYFQEHSEIIRAFKAVGEKVQP